MNRHISISRNLNRIVSALVAGLFLTACAQYSSVTTSHGSSTTATSSTRASKATTKSSSATTTSTSAAKTPSSTTTNNVGRVTSDGSTSKGRKTTSK